MNKLQEIIGERLGEEHFGVSELARELGMSRSNLHRRIQSATGKSVSQFMREIRLNKALELLQDSDLTVSEVAYKVGFGSATYFSKCFHDHFGIPPGDAERNGVREANPQYSYPEKVAENHNSLRIHAPWVISGLVVICAAVLLIIAFKPFTRNHPDQQYIIAVLPIRNDSPDQEKDYIVNSLMEEIMTKLNALEGLGVVSRTTSETYRNSDKSLAQIAKELQADYILEGSATFLNSQTRIRLQLIEGASDTHVWSEPYEQVITDENLFRVEEEVALAVARELNLMLNPKQKKEIERKPTENMEAYQSYLEARELLNVTTYQGENEPDDPRFTRMKQLLNHAIALDSSFSEAYTLMAHLYIHTLSFFDRESHPEKAYTVLDTGFQYVNKALSFYEGGGERRTVDLNYIQALNMKGTYYQLNGRYEEAQPIWEELNKYKQKAQTYLDYLNSANGCIQWNNYLCFLQNYLKFSQLKPADYLEPGWSLQQVYGAYRGAGFPKLAIQKKRRVLEMKMDTVEFFNSLAYTERCDRNYREALRYLEWLCNNDSTSAWYWTTVSRNYFFLGEKQKAIQVILERINHLKKEPSDLRPDFVVGYVFLLTGMKSKGDSILYHYINEMENLCKYPLPRTLVGYNHYNIARAYSILGDREKTMEYLDYLKNVQWVDCYLLNELKDWPSFGLVRDTPEFQEILQTLEKRFNDTHEQIARLLKDHGIDPA